MSTKQKILNTALKLFNANNTQAATTNHIAAEMGISIGNLHYHYKNREEIIFQLYEQMLEETTLLVQDLPKNITELFEHQKYISKVVWKYQFFYKELLFLLSRDSHFKERYLQDNIAHRQRIKISFENLITNGDMQTLDEQTLTYLVDSVMLVLSFWNPLKETLGQQINQQTQKEAMQYVHIAMRPYLTNQALEAIKKFKL